jgi:hypothetical protein
MNYPLFCECGKQYLVTAPMAGTTFTCTCGKVVEVPNLSTLRASVGYSANPEDYKLFRMIQNGDLPDERCVVCEEATSHVRQLHVTARLTYPDEPREFLWSDSLSFLSQLMHFLSKDEVKSKPDIVRQFDIPLRICRQCNCDVLDASSLQKVVAREPIYAELLRRYPDSTIEDAT